MRPAARPLAALIVVGALLVGGAFVAQEYRFVSTAETTTGTVETAEIETITRTRPSLSGRTEYRANVSYTYTVDGERYRNDAVFAGGYSYAGSGRRVARAATDFEEGATVTVHYDPGDPARAYLIPRYSFLPGYALVVAGLLLGAELLTPGTWLVDRVRGVVGAAVRSGNPRTGPGEATNEWDDPVADGPGDTSETGDGDRTIPRVTGRAAVGVWALAALGTLGAVGHYWLVSAPPYSFLAVGAAIVGVGLPAARLVVSRPWRA